MTRWRAVVSGWKNCAFLSAMTKANCAARGPYYFYYRSLFTKLKAGGRAVQFKLDPDQPDDELSVEDIVDQLVIRGTPDKVADDILTFREQTGDFGTLLYAGHDWKDPALARQSMRLMTEDVMPRVNAALGA